MKTCVLGHPWNDGLYLCPTCGFGPRAQQPAMAAATTSESTALVTPAAAAAPAPVVDDRPRSDDGRWVWNGTAWDPVTDEPVLAPLVPAQGGPVDEPTADPAAGEPATHRKGLTLGKPSPRVVAGVGLLVVAGGIGAYALGLFGSSGSTPPPPVTKGHAKSTGTAARGVGSPASPATRTSPGDARLKSELRDLATAAEVAYTETGSWATAEPKYDFAHNPNVTYTAGTATACAFAHDRAVSNAPYYVWSSKHGFLTKTYTSDETAIAACQ